MKKLIYCGAHVGSSLSKMVAGFDMIDVFEANKDLAARLQMRFSSEVSSGKMRIHNKAVGVEKGSMTFHVYGHDGGSGSVGEMNPEAVKVIGHCWPKGHLDLHGEYNVEVVNLCDFCFEAGIDFIDVLVLDVQGMDVSVLETMEPYLVTGSISKIQLEVDSDTTSHYLGTPDNSISRVQKFMAKFRGYKQTVGPTENWVPDQDHLQADLTFEAQS